jgi:hypothetical protein
MRIRFALILIASLVVQACAHKKRLSSMTDDQLITFHLSEIYEISTSDLSAVEKAERHLRFFAAAPTILPFDDDAIDGIVDVTNFYHRAYEDFEIVSNTYRDLVIVIHGDLATRRFVGTGVFRVSGQPEQIAGTSRYLDVLIKENDQWKILLHSWVPVSWE